MFALVSLGDLETNLDGISHTARHNTILVLSTTLLSVVLDMFLLTQDCFSTMLESVAEGRVPIFLKNNIKYLVTITLVVFVLLNLLSILAFDATLIAC